MDLPNLKLRVDKLLQRAKDNAKETAGLKIRAELILFELQEVRQILEDVTIVTQQNNVVLGDMAGGDIKK